MKVTAIEGFVAITFVRGGEIDAKNEARLLEAVTL